MSECFHCNGDRVYKYYLTYAICAECSDDISIEDYNEAVSRLEKKENKNEG